MSEIILHSFNTAPDGLNPTSNLVSIGSILYGTTSAGGDLTNDAGIIFSYDTMSTTYTILHTFQDGTISNDGVNPQAALINISGVLYGTTSAGGDLTNNAGIIFSYDTMSTVYNILHTFQDTSGPLLLTDGAYPQAALIYISGVLYGTTNTGGLYTTPIWTNGTGIIFSYDTMSALYTILYNFGDATSSGVTGVLPTSALVNISGVLYGTTSAGGSSTDDGVLFRYNMSSNIYTVLHTFNDIASNDGSTPYGDLLNVSGVLYGTTAINGSNGYGTIFTYDIIHGTYTSINNFNNARQSMGGLIYTASSSSVLYGTAFHGGTLDNGAIFSYGIPTPPETQIPVSSTCFPADTLILTNKGHVAISKINPDIHSINNNKIIAITKTTSLDEYLVCFEKNALFINYPSEKTLISKDHKIYYKGKLVEAYTLLGLNNKITKIKYTGETLYNVLLDKYTIMSVNNLICETLHPENMVSKLYSGNFNQESKNKIIKQITDISNTNKNANKNTNTNKKIYLNIY